MIRVYLLIFILGVTFTGYTSEEETPFEYNFRWYKNDFKWWNIWYKELYGNLGKDTARDRYNAEQVIASINRLKKWVVSDKVALFDKYEEFYKSIKQRIEKGTLKRPEIRNIKSILKENSKEFIARFHYKNIEPEKWISREIRDTSPFEKIEIAPPLTKSKERKGYRYIAHRYGKVFHKKNCKIVEDIKESDRVYFKTKREALSSNRRPCRQCRP